MKKGKERTIDSVYSKCNQFEQKGNKYDRPQFKDISMLRINQKSCDSHKINFSRNTNTTGNTNRDHVTKKKKKKC